MKYGIAALDRLTQFKQNLLLFWRFWANQGEGSHGRRTRGPAVGPRVVKPHGRGCQAVQHLAQQAGPDSRPPRGRFQLPPYTYLVF